VSDESVGSLNSRELSVTKRAFSVGVERVGESVRSVISYLNKESSSYLNKESCVYLCDKSLSRSVFVVCLWLVVVSSVSRESAQCLSSVCVKCVCQAQCVCHLRKSGVSVEFVWQVSMKECVCRMCGVSACSECGGCVRQVCASSVCVKCVCPVFVSSVCVVCVCPQYIDLYLYICTYVCVCMCVCASCVCVCV